MIMEITNQEVIRIIQILENNGDLRFALVRILLTELLSKPSLRSKLSREIFSDIRREVEPL